MPELERLRGRTTDGPAFDGRRLDVEPGPNDHPAAIPALVEAIAAGRPAETEAAANIRSLAMVEAAVASARSGGWVEISAEL